MAKWADYGISEKKMNDEDTYIEWVKVHPFNDNNQLKKPFFGTREQVITELNAGRTFITILENEKGTFNKGANVNLVPENDPKYIRTDKNEIEMDNLEKLPEIQGIIVYMGRTYRKTNSGWVDCKTNISNLPQSLVDILEKQYNENTAKQVGKTFKTKVHCEHCYHRWEVTISDLVQQSSVICPKCNQSFIPPFTQGA